MIRPRTRRESEILACALHRAANIESDAGNPIAASLLREILRDVDREQMRGAA